MALPAYVIMHKRRQQVDKQCLLFTSLTVLCLNPIALRLAKTVYSFGLSECSRVKVKKIQHALRLFLVKMHDK